MSGKTRTIPSGWKETTLGEVLYPVSDTFDFTGVEKVHFLNTGDILEGKLLHSDLVLVKNLPGQAKKKFQTGDILFSEIRPANLRYMLVDFDSSNSVASTKLMVLRSRPGVDTEYIYKLLTYKDNLKEFQAIAESRSGTFPQITFESISHFPILLPPLPEQKAIAAVLSSLDDKIELLREQNKTLEATAQVLFKEWFVNFNFPSSIVIPDATSESANAGGPESIRSYKPHKLSGGKMTHSELGEIPEGWRVGKLGEVTNVVGGTTPSTKNPDFWNGGVPWTSPRDLSNLDQAYLLRTEKSITKEGLSQVSSGLLPVGTLLLSSRAPIGYLAITGLQVAINQGYIAFLPGEYYSNYYMWCWLKQNMGVVESSANGSTFMEISKASFRNIVTLIPPKDVLGEFDKVMHALLEKDLLNLKEVDILSVIRDKLLSMLVTGRLLTRNTKE